MFKIETVVRVFVFTALLCGQALHAQDKTSQDALAAAINNVCDADSKPKSYNKAKCEELTTKATSSGSSYGCTGDYESAYKKAQEEFLNACGEAGVSSGGPAGDIGCGYAMARCKCLSGGLTSSERSKLECSDVESKSSSRSSSKGGVNMDSARRMFKYCPAMASSDYKKNQEKLDKSNEKIESAEEKLPALLDAVQKAQTDAAEKQDSIDKEEADADEKFEQDTAQAKQKKEEEQKRIMDQISQIQSQIGTLEEQTGQLDLSKVDADMKRTETITQVDLNCHAQAAAIVGKKQEEAKALLAAGKLNKGGQKAMMKRVGISDRQSWEREAAKYYQWCLQSKPTKDSKVSANKVYDSMVRQAEKSKTDLRARKAQLLEQMKKMKDPNGQCGQVMPSADGSSSETEMCRAARTAAEEQVRLGNGWIRKKQNFATQRNRAAQAAQQAVQSKMAQAQLAQRNLDSEKTRRDKLQEWNDLADKNGVSEGERAKFDKAQAKFSAFNVQAQNLVSCSMAAEKPCANGNECDQASKFFELVNAGRKPVDDAIDPIMLADDNSESETPRSSTTQPASSGSSAPGANQ
ncbi:MAG: hypothetical protein KF799_01660 [Bdellovibrionales bacterium]|nr:hypothetical protein [Bdellovibrionales bacterium]